MDVDLDTTHLLHWLVTALLSVGAVIVGFLVQRLIQQYDGKVDRQVFSDYKRDIERTLDTFVASLDDKADKSTLNQLMEDIRRRQATADERLADMMRDHGRLLQILEDRKRGR